MTGTGEAGRAESDVGAIVEAFSHPRERMRALARGAFDEAKGLDELAQALSRHPLLAARFVRLANASFWGPFDESASLARTVAQLGGATQWIVLVCALASTLPEHAPGVPFDAQGWHRRAWTRAVAALAIARSCNGGFGPEAFASAYVLELGELALALARPELHGALSAPERADLGRRVGVALFADWGLPPQVARAHADLRAEPGAERQDPPLVETLAFAEAAVGLFEGEDKGRALTRLEEHAAQAFEMPPDVVYETVSLLDGYACEARRVFDTGQSGPLSAPHPARAGPTPSRAGRAERARRDAVVPPELEHRRWLSSDPALLDEELAVPGRTAFERFLDREIQARRKGVVRRPLCVLVLSLEDYPRVHRERGAEAARGWLAEAAGTLAKRVRRGDLFARLGGSYFGVCMSEADRAAMELLVGRLREAVSKQERADTGRATSFAAGGASLARAAEPDDGRALLRRAVLLLKEALGERGGVRLSAGPSSPPHAA